MGVGNLLLGVVHQGRGGIKTKALAKEMPLGLITQQPLRRPKFPSHLPGRDRFNSRNGFTVAILGAHMSMAGGYYKAVEIAHRAGCDCVQLFTKNNNQWRATDITPEDVSRFRNALGKLGISHPIAHDSYLINLASPDKALWRKSVDAFAVELRRAEQLGIPYVVAHPGSLYDQQRGGGAAGHNSGS